MAGAHAHQAARGWARSRCALGSSGDFLPHRCVSPSFSFGLSSLSMQEGPRTAWVTGGEVRAQSRSEALPGQACCSPAAALSVHVLPARLLRGRRHALLCLQTSPTPLGFGNTQRPQEWKKPPSRARCHRCGGDRGCFRLPRASQTGCLTRRAAVLILWHFIAWINIPPRPGCNHSTHICL